jgi:hypothetical protein
MGLKNLKFILLSSTLSFLSVHSNASIQISLENDANTLLNTISNSGITFSNSSTSGNALQSGVFSDGFSSGFGLDSGIILSTGSVLNAEGPHTPQPESVAFNGPGSSAVSAVAGFSTFDAASLSFDFQFDSSLSDSISLSLIFGSDEYNESVNTQINDGFAFTVDGVNQAILDDGSSISINTINNNSNSDIFNDNTTGIFENTNIDGFTNLLTFEISGLNSGVHTAEFTIADAFDATIDSWVLIGANSFTANNVTAVPELNLASASTSLLCAFSLLLLLFERKSKSIRFK